MHPVTYVEHSVRERICGWCTDSRRIPVPDVTGLRRTGFDRAGSVVGSTSALCRTGERE